MLDCAHLPGFGQEHVVVPLGSEHHSFGQHTSELHVVHVVCACVCGVPSVSLPQAGTSRYYDTVVLAQGNYVAHHVRCSANCNGRRCCKRTLLRLLAWRASRAVQVYSVDAFEGPWRSDVF
eukprot:1562060-Amphidinium_carterae.1